MWKSNLKNLEKQSDYLIILINHIFKKQINQIEFLN